MLTRTEKQIIEAIKETPQVTLIVPGADGQEIRVSTKDKKAKHDIALAIQSFYLRITKIK